MKIKHIVKVKDGKLIGEPSIRQAFLIIDNKDKAYDAIEFPDGSWKIYESKDLNKELEKIK